MTSENNCIIENVDNACVETPSDEIGVKEHDNFCDEPYDDSFDHNCGDAHIENVVGNVDCVVDNVHANLLENVGDINAKRDDDICDNSSNACKNVSYDLHNNALKCGNDFWVDNEINFLNPYDFNDSDSFDSSDDDDGNCVDTCENNSFNSNDNDGLELFTFYDNSLINEHVGELHDMLCNVDDELNVDASLHELNDVEIVTFLDNCLDDAFYIHELIGEDKEETGGDLRDVLSIGCPDTRSWEMRKLKRAIPLRFGHPSHCLRKSMDIHVKSGSPMRLSWGMRKGEIYPVGTGRLLHSSRKSMEIHVRSGGPMVGLEG
nr:hypothetical protein Itr_chr03CG09200 [Ipomoea trifida]